MARPNKGPRLERNSRGIWEVRWTDNGRSKRVSTRTDDRQEASRFLAGFLLEMDREAEGDRVTVGKVLDVYLREHVEAGPVVSKVRQRNIDANLRDYFEAMTLDQITPAVILKYQRLRAVGSVGSRRAPSSGTWRRELNMLKAAISYYAKTRPRALSPEDIPYIPLPESPGARDLWLTETEAEQFMAAARKHGSERARLFIAIALNTASRRAAIETLTWDQVDFDAGLIHFNPPGRAQSKKRRVPVPINAALAAELQAGEGPRTGYVLGHPGSITRAFEVVCRAAAKEHGNRKFLDVTPHTLRHTWATLAARRGVDLYKIAGVLGDTLATVQKNYLHHCPDHLRDAVETRKAA